MKWGISIGYTEKRKNILYRFEILNRQIKRDIIGEKRLRRKRT